VTDKRTDRRMDTTRRHRPRYAQCHAAINQHIATQFVYKFKRFKLAAAAPFATRLSLPHSAPVWPSAHKMLDPPCESKFFLPL